MRRVKPRAIRAFKNGDKDAFEEIFYAYKDILYYLCYFYIRDYDDASDCVQEIFIKLTSKISLYDERKAAFEAWFLALTKAHIFNFIRDKNRYNNRIVIDEEAVLNYGDKDYRELEDTLCDLERLMGQEMYVIYILRTAYNVSFENISQMLNLNRETTRRMYYQSLKIVDEYMGDR